MSSTTLKIAALAGDGIGPEGTMYRVLIADIEKSLVADRTRALRSYIDNWLFDDSPASSSPGPPLQPGQTEADP